MISQSNASRFQDKGPGQRVWLSPVSNAKNIAPNFSALIRKLPNSHLCPSAPAQGQQQQQQPRAQPQALPSSKSPASVPHNLPCPSSHSPMNPQRSQEINLIFNKLRSYTNPQLSVFATATPFAEHSLQKYKEALKQENSEQISLQLPYREQLGTFARLASTFQIPPPPPAGTSSLMSPAAKVLQLCSFSGTSNSFD